jgi:hypothetical protein
MKSRNKVNTGQRTDRSKWGHPGMAMKVTCSESGQMLVMLALSMTVLLGFLALAADVGLQFRAQRNMQVAADAAAIAAALDYKYNTSDSSAETAGLTAAENNGLTVAKNCTADNGSEVCVSCPPADGPNAGSAGFCEAIVSQPNFTVLMGLFNHASMTVAARAVAGAGAHQGCMWTLARSGADIAMVGNGTIDIPNCEIFDDSSSSDALDLVGNGGIDAEGIGIVGGYSTTGNETIDICNPTCTPGTPTTGIAPAASPITLTPPTLSTGTNCQPLQSIVGNGTLNLTPGCYDGISATGNVTVNFAPGNYVINGNISPTGNVAINFGAGNYTVNGSFTDTGNSPVTFGAGVYSFTGNLDLTGNGTLTGTGVTFYTEGQTQVTGNSGSDLEAPTSGPYNGVLFYQSATDNDAITITGNSGAILKGIFYAPDAAMTFTGNSSTGIYADFIVDSLSLTGNTAFQDYQTINPSALGGKLTMVE